MGKGEQANKEAPAGRKEGWGVGGKPRYPSLTVPLCHCYAASFCVSCQGRKTETGSGHITVCLS